MLLVLPGVVDILNHVFSISICGDTFSISVRFSPTSASIWWIFCTLLLISLHAYLFLYLLFYSRFAWNIIVGPVVSILQWCDFVAHGILSWGIYNTQFPFLLPSYSFSLLLVVVLAASLWPIFSFNFCKSYFLCRMIHVITTLQFQSCNLFVQFFWDCLGTAF